MTMKNCWIKTLDRLHIILPSTIVCGWLEPSFFFTDEIIVGIKHPYGRKWVRMAKTRREVRLLLNLGINSSGDDSISFDTHTKLVLVSTRSMICCLESIITERVMAFRNFNLTWVGISRIILIKLVYQMNNGYQNINLIEHDVWHHLKKNDSRNLRELGNTA